MKELTITPYNEQDNKLIVKKHSSLIQTNNITTLQQRKAFNVMIYVAKQNLFLNPEQREFEIDLKLLRELAGLKDTNLKNIKEALRVMQDIKLEYNILGKDTETRESIVVLPKVKIETVKNNSTLTFEFPTDILNHIKNPKMYANLDLLIIRDLNSKYSLALYELLKDYINLGQLKIRVDDLKKALGVLDNKGYKIFSEFNKRVLKPAIKEINDKTDITANYKGIKKGIEYIEVVFTMKLKDNNKVALIDDLTLDLQQLGFDYQEIANIREKYDNEYIKQNIDVAKAKYKEGKIDNLKGYIITAFKKDFRETKTEYEKQEIQRKEELKQERERQEREEREKQEREIAEKKEKYDNIENKLKEKGEEYKQQLINEYRETIRGNTFAMVNFDKYGVENPINKRAFLDFVNSKLNGE